MVIQNGWKKKNKYLMIKRIVLSVIRGFMRASSTIIV